MSYQTLDPDDLLKGRQLGGQASYGYDGSNKAHTQSAMVAAQMNPGAQILFGYTHRTNEETRLRNAVPMEGNGAVTAMHSVVTVSTRLTPKSTMLWPNWFCVPIQTIKSS